MHKYLDHIGSRWVQDRLAIENYPAVSTEVVLPDARALQAEVECGFETGKSEKAVSKQSLPQASSVAHHPRPPGRSLYTLRNIGGLQARIRRGGGRLDFL